MLIKSGFWKQSTLARKFALGSATMTLCVTLFIGTFSTIFTRNQIIFEVERELQRESVTQAQRMELYLEAAAHNLENMANATLTMNALVDSHGQSNYLVPFLRDFSISEKLDIDVGLFDFQGKSIAQSTETVEISSTTEHISPKDMNGIPITRSTETENINISNTHIFRDAMNGKATSDFHLNGKDGYISISFPVFHNATDGAEGVIVARIKLENLQKLFGQDKDDPFFIKISNKDDKTVWTSNWPQNIELLTSSRKIKLPPPLDNLNLNVVVARDRTASLEPVKNFMIAIILIAICIVIIIAFISTIIGRKLSQPLRELNKAANRIVADGYFDQIIPEGGNDEIGRLANSFREMLGQLHVSYRVLEARVLSRTKELDEARIRLDSILNNVVDGIVTVDSSGQIQSLNYAAENLFGRSIEDLNDKNIGTLIDIRDLNLFLHPSSDSYQGDQSHVLTETKLFQESGHVIPIDYAIGEEMEIGGKTLMTLVIRNISEQKEVERLKEEFISSVSHELRTPLTSIGGAIGLLKAGKNEPLSPRAAKLVDIAQQNCRRLESLVDEILDLEKLESGNMSFDYKPLSIRELTKQTMESCGPYISKAGKTAQFWSDRNDFIVSGDEGRLMQVMNNLLSNAAKYAAPKSRIDVFIARVDQNVRVSIVDQGPGIPVTFRDRMFTRFGQVDGSNTRTTSGTGLGLAITRAIIESHHGKIRYRSRSNIGTIFYFDLPLLEQRSIAPPQKQPPVWLGGTNPENVQEMADIVSQLGFDPIIIASAAATILRHSTGAFNIMRLTKNHITSDYLRAQLDAAAQSEKSQIFWIGEHEHA